ncbi:unnamed protein product, partial [Agarophyton chilense]
ADAAADAALRVALRAAAPSKRVVLLFASNFAYRTLALNLFCQLRRLRLTNYVAVALDARVYAFLSAHGVRVVLLVDHHHHHQLDVDVHVDADVFGSKRFVQTSRQKSRLVLRVLQLGYHVLFCDVDVALLHHPMHVLQRYARVADILIQSDRAASQSHLPLNHNLNSGLYLARSNARTISAFTAIVRYAAAIRRSEQKAFNYVLCGAFKHHRAGPGLRVAPHRCLYLPCRTTVSVLSLDVFPNGSNASFWNNTVASLSRDYPRACALHVNYVTGRQHKIQRLRRIGFWFVEQQQQQQQQLVCTDGQLETT